AYAPHNSSRAAAVPRPDTPHADRQLVGRLDDGSRNILATPPIATPRLARVSPLPQVARCQPRTGAGRKSSAYRAHNTAGRRAHVGTFALVSRIGGLRTTLASIARSYAVDISMISRLS